MADTGLTVWAAGFWPDDFWAEGFWADGDAPPPVVTETNSGGWFVDFDNYAMQRGRRKKREEIEEEIESIKDTTTKEIAKLLKEQEAKDEERADLARLQALADRYAQRGVDVPRPMLATVMKASEERTRNALEQMRREMERLIEDEELAVIQALLLDE
jgi:hypothetical protein